MKRFLTIGFLACAIFGMSSFGFAEETRTLTLSSGTGTLNITSSNDASSSGTGTLTLIGSNDASKASATCPTDGTSCSVTAGLEKLPKLAYMVGEESICCSELAKAKAKETGAKLVYLVGTQKFDNETAAFAGLVDQTEKFVEQFATPHECKVSGSISIAGQECDCSVMAGEIAQKVKQAMDTVAVSYKVGDKVCSCPVEAKANATSSGLKLLFVVNKEETECEQTSRLNLAKAKYQAALIAMAKTSNSPTTN